MHQPHNPVLKVEVVKFLNIRNHCTYIDATFGAGGHTAAILKEAECTVYALDKDKTVQQYADLLKLKYKNFHFIREKFSKLDFIISSLGISKVSGIVFDLGLSSMQIEDDIRGFSFLKDSPLDMRVDDRDEITAKHVVNTYSQKALSDLIFNLGGERRSHQIAQNIVNSRKVRKILTTKELVNIILNSKGMRFNTKIHPATKTFQAIRMVVNNEIEELKAGLELAIHSVLIGGVIAVISFHSVEDFIIKNFFKTIINNNESNFGFHYLHKKVIVPERNEILTNIRARSAKLRVIQRIK